jgi:hypothetical protein
MRALSLAIMIVTLTGVAFATPVAVLRLDPGGYIVPLADGEPYEYSYQQSIYQVPVIEEHVRTGDTLGVVRVRSTDLRAVEYFRWDARIRRVGDELIQDAPPNHVAALTIRITHEGTQRLRGARFDIALRDRFGESLLTVAPEHVPALFALLRRAIP